MNEYYTKEEIDAMLEQTLRKNEDGVYVAKTDEIAFVDDKEDMSYKFYYGTQKDGTRLELSHNKETGKISLMAFNGKDIAGGEVVLKSVNGMIYDNDLATITKPGETLNVSKGYHANGVVAVDVLYENGTLKYHMYDENGNRVNAVDFRPDGTIETSKGFVKFEEKQ